jgi:hypothetical protein
MKTVKTNRTLILERENNPRFRLSLNVEAKTEMLERNFIFIFINVATHTPSLDILFLTSPTRLYAHQISNTIPRFGFPLSSNCKPLTFLFRDRPVRIH